jgi:hypothetical protein
MKYGRLIAIIVGLPFAGALAGTALGFCIGTWMPGYYRSFMWGSGDPAIFGMVLGAGQGFAVGVILAVLGGLIAALWIVWRHSRRNLEERLDEILARIAEVADDLERLREIMRRLADGRVMPAVEGSEKSPSR